MFVKEVENVAQEVEDRPDIKQGIEMKTSQLQTIVKDLNMKTLCENAEIDYNNLLYRVRVDAELKRFESDALVKALTNLRDKLNLILGGTE